MAGSEQMNFLVATNYSTAKINLEQYKAQVPSWMVSGTIAASTVGKETSGGFSESQVSSLQQAKLLQ